MNHQIKKRENESNYQLTFLSISSSMLVLKCLGNVKISITIFESNKGCLFLDKREVERYF